MKALIKHALPSIILPVIRTSGLLIDTVFT